MFIESDKKYKYIEFYTVILHHLVLEYYDYSNLLNKTK